MILFFHSKETASEAHRELQKDYEDSFQLTITLGHNDSLFYNAIFSLLQCLHTGNPNYGAFAHSNYYPNGASHQPGCPTPDTDWCSHWRVIDLYAESLASNKFIARECANYTAYKAGQCNRNAVGVMGGINLDMK